MNKSIIPLVILVIFSGCKIPEVIPEQTLDEIPEGPPTYRMHPTGADVDFVTNDAPDPKYAHSGPDFELNGEISQGMLLSLDDPLIIQLVMITQDEASYNSSYSGTITYQANGLGYEKSFSGAFSGSEMQVDTITDQLDMSNGLDFCDVDGDGEYLNLDNHPDSDDYALISFKTIKIDDVTVWENPDM